MKLCQRSIASCGACCGLYNRPDPDRESVRDELRRHGRALARADRTAAGFGEAARRLGLEADAPGRIFASIRCCALVGFLDADETRVGCLAHPAATGGVDLRACGVYDVETCERFLCPSHADLDERAAAIVEAATDWYLYGLVVTDGPFVRAVLRAIEEGAGRALAPEELLEADGAGIAEPLRALLSLKEELAAGSDGHFGAFRTPRAPGGEGEGSPGAEAILEALGADERSGNDAERLLPVVERRLLKCVKALRGARG